MFKNALLLIVSIVVAVLLFDGGLRLYEKYFPARVLDTDGPVVDLPSMSYNNFGPVPKVKPESEYRLLSFGDSFGFSITKYSYSYHGVAAARLNAAAGTKNVAVVNVGEPGVSFYQYIKGYSFWGDVFEHDGAIFTVYLGNDILDVNYNWAPRDAELHRRFSGAKINFATGRPMSSWIPQRYPLRFMDHFYAAYLQNTGQVKTYKPQVNDDRYNMAYVINDEERLLTYAKKQLENFDPEFVAKLTEGYKGFVALVRYASEARKQGKHIVIMLAPNATQVEPQMRAALASSYEIDMSRYDFGLSAYLLTRIVEEIDGDIPVIDLIGTFECASARGLQLYPSDNSHWSVAGNQLAGESLAVGLANTWMPERREQLADIDTCVSGAEALIVTNEQMDKRAEVYQQHIKPLIDAVQSGD